MDTESKIAVAAIAVGAAVSLIAVLLGWALNSYQHRKNAEQAARERTEEQADELACAIQELRLVGHANDRLWNGRLPTAITAFWSAVQFASGYSQSLHPGRPALISGFGKAAEMIAYRDRDRNRSAAALTAPMNRVLAAAMPLTRHSDPDVATTSSRLLDGALEHVNEEALAERFTAFRQAVQKAASAPAPWSRRLLRREAAQP